MTARCLTIVLAFAAPALAQTPPKPADVKPIDALKITLDRNELDKARQIAYLILWEDKNRADWPQATVYLVQILEKQGDREQAFAYLSLIPKMLKDPAVKDTPQNTMVRKWQQVQMDRWNKTPASGPAGKSPASTGKPSSAGSAPAGRKFAGPQEVGEAWMDNVSFELHNLHAMYMWKQVGGRKDVSPDWIHNTQGRMHKSGAKLMDTVDGRTGVLYVCSRAAGSAEPVTFLSIPQSAVMRIGAKAYQFPATLSVIADGKEIFSQTIDAKNWSDLKVQMPKDAREVRIEIKAGPGQKMADGMWFDYIDFFED